MNIEAALTKRIGAAGAKLHTARSRNDQIALDKISVSEMKTFPPLFDVNIVKVFNVRGSLAETKAIGAPSPENVAVQIVRWRSELFDRSGAPQLSNQRVRSHL